MDIKDKLSSLINFIKKNSIAIVIICSIGILIYFYMLGMYTKYCKPKIVVFDFDETMGHLVELGIFKDSLQTVQNIKLTEPEFFNLCDLYPEFYRPKLFEILKYLKNKKDKNICQKIMIYTNNQGPKSWVESVKNYFEFKLKDKVFDQIIAAFHVNGKHVEVGRTSHMKNVPDLIRCTKIPPNTEICFLDDQYHEEMKHPNVYYINLKPYVYHIPYDEMIKRYLNSDMGRNITNQEIFTENMKNELKKYQFTIEHKDPLEYKVDHVISKKIMLYLDEFFDKKMNNSSLKKSKHNLSQYRKTLKQKN
jgi:hypothetical protein